MAFFLFLLFYYFISIIRRFCMALFLSFPLFLFASISFLTLFYIVFVFFVFFFVFYFSIFSKKQIKINSTRRINLTQNSFFSKFVDLCVGFFFVFCVEIFYFCVFFIGYWYY